MNDRFKIHSGVMNEYQPRAYPQDTPEQKAARAEGFEAGRQYEASLRDGDNPAVLIPGGPLADRLLKIHDEIYGAPESYSAGFALEELKTIVSELRGAK